SHSIKTSEPPAITYPSDDSRRRARKPRKKWRRARSRLPTAGPECPNPGPAGGCPIRTACPGRRDMTDVIAWGDRESRGGSALDGKGERSGKDGTGEGGCLAAGS